MFTKEMLYDRVFSVEELDHSSFEEDLNCAVGELSAMFGEKYVLSEEGSSLPTKDEYFMALCSAILFYRRGDESERKRFLERAREAFLTVWRKKVHLSFKKEGYQ